MDVKTRLGELRTRRGLGAAQLADQIGVSRQTVYAIEAGTYVPNTAVSLRLARALETTVEEIFQIVQRLNRDQKLTVLLVEQNAALALAIAHHGYVMENGRIVLEGAAAALRENADIKEFYLGLTEVGARKSYRDVKHYKRRKRWLS